MTRLLLEQRRYLNTSTVVLYDTIPILYEGQPPRWQMIKISYTYYDQESLKTSLNRCKLTRCCWRWLRGWKSTKVGNEFGCVNVELWESRSEIIGNIGIASSSFFIIPWIANFNLFLRHPQELMTEEQFRDTIQVWAGKKLSNDDAVQIRTNTATTKISGDIMVTCSQNYFVFTILQVL